MRIGVNCYELNRHMGGMRQYFHRLFGHLLVHDSSNDYVFFAREQAVEELDRLASDRWREHWVPIQTQEDIDVGRSNLDLYFCPFSIIWPRPVRAPSVVTIHDLQEMYFPDFFRPLDLFNRALHLPGSTRSADAVVTVSEFTKQTVEEHHGVSGRRIVSSPLCVGETFLRALAAPLAGDAPFERFLLYPANRWRHKNHAALLEALRRLRDDEGLRVRLVLTGHDVGGGPPVEELIREMGLQDQVRSVGYVSATEIVSLYRQAAGLIFPSLFEGFGLPLLEAMTAGCPAAVSRIPSLMEIGGEHALYFDPHSPDEIALAIRRLWSDSALCERMAAGGRLRAQGFHPQRMAEAHLQAFEIARRRYSHTRYWVRRVALERLHARRVRRRFRDHLDSPPAGLGVESGIRVRFDRGWHQLEGDAENWWRWSKGPASITITSDECRRVALEADALSAAAPNSIDLLLDGRSQIRWEIPSTQNGFGPLATVVLDLRQGASRLEIRSREPAVQFDGDPRKLAVAVKNLRFRPL
ncbi:MAG: glycosyltransferase [Acidobacteria bacterium]|nr:glycosyltransferase [Acidobacteriota bacterium]